MILAARGASLRPSALKWMGRRSSLSRLQRVYVAVFGEPHQEESPKASARCRSSPADRRPRPDQRGDLLPRHALRGLRTKLPVVPAALVGGLVFGGLHALTGITAVPPLIAFGFLLCLLYEKTGSVVPGSSCTC